MKLSQFDKVESDKKNENMCRLWTNTTIEIGIPGEMMFGITWWESSDLELMGSLTNVKYLRNFS